MKLLKYVTKYGDGQSVTYWRALVTNDEAAHNKAEELNNESKDDLDAYNAACGDGSAGVVKQTVEEVDG